MPSKVPGFLSFADAVHLAPQFEETLKCHKIEIKPGSPLEHSLLLLHKIQECFDSPSAAPPWPTFVPDIQEALGTIHLMRLVIRNADRPEFEQLVPHLRLLNEGVVVITKGASTTDDSSNKILELITALAALETGTDLHVDEPIHSSKGNNPDVLVKMNDGLLWGFACKVVGGDAPESLFDLIKSGADQIERSPADTGIVHISFKNRFPHHLFIPVDPMSPPHDPDLLVHPDLGSIQIKMQRWVEDRFKQMREVKGREAILDIFLGRKALPGVLVSQMTVASVLHAGNPVLCLIGFFHLVQQEYFSFDAPTSFDPIKMQILNKLNRGFRVI